MHNDSQYDLENETKSLVEMQTIFYIFQGHVLAAAVNLISQ